MENLEFFKRGIISFIITIILSLIGFFIFNKCTDNSISNVIVNGKKQQVVKTVIDTVFVTKVLTKYMKGKDIYHTEIKTYKSDTLFINRVDTVKVLKDYSTIRYYVDTLILNDGFIIIKDTILNNKIESRNWLSNINEKIITKQIYIKEPSKNNIYIGLNLNQEKQFKFNSFSTSFLLKTKKDKIFVLSLGIDKNSQPILGTSYYFKIK